MTWKEFKSHMEKKGVKDETVIDSIDIINVSAENLEVKFDIAGEVIVSDTL